VYQKRNLRLNDTTEDHLFKMMWLRRNRGLLARVARELGVSGSFARQVFWGKRRSAKVEEVLASHGLIVGPPVRRRHAKAA
jgi:hypothetical protein